MADVTPRTRPLIRWVLGLSLAVNLLVVGVVAGAFWRHGGPPDRGQVADVAGYGAAYVRALPKESQRTLRRGLVAERGTLPSRKERRALNMQLLAALRAETFDTQALQALFETQRDYALRVQSRAQMLWLEEVAAMSPAARRAFADHLEEMLRRPRKTRKP